MLKRKIMHLRVGLGRLTVCATVECVSVRLVAVVCGMYLCC